MTTYISINKRNANAGCTSGAYTEEIFPDDDYDWEYDKNARLPG